MINRRRIRTKVMQALYAQVTTEDPPETVFDLLLKEIQSEVEDTERKKNISGDGDLLKILFFESIQNAAWYDDYIKQKAENWELERIAKLDRILMHMAICEMLNFEEIPVKVTINEYLELAKLYSTPNSSRFINGILDSLYADFKKNGKIIKRGRGLIDQSTTEKTTPPNPV